MQHCRAPARSPSTTSCSTTRTRASRTCTATGPRPRASHPSRAAVAAADCTCPFAQRDGVLMMRALRSKNALNLAQLSSVPEHRSLLAHFFHAASQQSVLAPHGIVHVSLAGDQPKRWKIVEQAQRHGLALLDSRAFPTPGLRGIYEPKRHHTGRSFQGRGLAGTSWSFGRAAEFPDVALGGLSGWRRPPWTWRDAPSKAATGSAEALTCPECGREFRDPRGLKQHIHMVHTLGVARLNEGGGHPCPHCEKDLGSPEALDQHVRAKHGGDAESLKPDWIGKVRDDRPGHVSAFATGGGAPGAVIACGVCGYDFASKEELDQHMANLKPVQVRRPARSVHVRGARARRPTREAVPAARAGRGGRVSVPGVQTAVPGQQSPAAAPSPFGLRPSRSV
ncbi:unnamed protein product [Pedinophyceae sp. YPF-701]|nr:unnamed protein product [Pedinophyceae sp. YPF-701]